MSARSARVIIASTRAAAGEYADKCGPIIAKWLGKQGFSDVEPVVVADGGPVGEALHDALDAEVDLIITSGGTGEASTPAVTHKGSSASLDGLSPDAAGLPAEARSAKTGEFGFACSVTPWQEFHEAAGRSYLKFVLRKANGNVSEAARLLCLERAYLHRLMKKLGVQRDVVVLD